MFHDSCRRISKVLGLALEIIGKSTVYELARTTSSRSVIFSKPRYRRCINVDDTKLSVMGVWVNVWSTVDIDSGKL